MAQCWFLYNLPSSLIQNRSLSQWVYSGGFQVVSHLPRQVAGGSEEGLIISILSTVL